MLESNRLQRTTYCLLNHQLPAIPVLSVVTVPKYHSQQPQLDWAELKSKEERTDTQRVNTLPSLPLFWRFRLLYAHCRLANYHGVLCYPPLPPSNRAQHTPTSPAGMGRTDSNLPVTALGRAVIKPSVLLR